MEKKQISKNETIALALDELINMGVVRKEKNKFVLNVEKFKTHFNSVVKTSDS